jgi:hypothetical protein
MHQSSLRPWQSNARPRCRSECASAVKSAYKKSMKKMSYQWIANVLRVYPEEAAVISGVIGKPFPAASALGGVVEVVAGSGAPSVWLTSKT